MANISDLILRQVTSKTGGVELPSEQKDGILKGLSDSILSSLTQTAVSPGGVDKIKELLTGKTAAAKSDITALAGNIFNSDVLSKLKLGDAGTALKGLIPGIMGSLSGIIKDQDGDGDIDLDDLILTLKGGSGGGGLLSKATSILGSLFGNKA